MASGTDYTQKYQRAITAYMNGSYEEAAQLTDQLVGNHPQDPNLRLLRGHIHCCLQSYEDARTQYRMVLDLSSDPELVECAQTSLADVDRFQGETQAVSDPDTISLQETPTAAKLEPELPAVSDPGTSSLHQATPFETLPGTEPDSTFIDPFNPSPAEAEESTQLFNFTLPEDLAAALEQTAETSQFPAASEETTLQPEADPTAAQAPSDPSHQPAGDTLTFRQRPPAVEEPGEFLIETAAHSSAAPPSPEDPSTLELDFLDDLGDPTFYEIPAGPPEEQSSAGSLSLFPDPTLAVQPLEAQTTEVALEDNPNTPRFIPVDLTAQSPDTAEPGRGSRWLSPWLSAAAAGIVSGLAVAAVLQLSPRWSPGEEAAVIRAPETGLAALVAGMTTGVTTLVITQLSRRRWHRTTAAVQSQMEAIALGNWSPQTLPASERDLGPLAPSFNRMMLTINQMTGEAQQRAAEQEMAKDALQRQVIRLLDEVEGAAQGDLTVQAEVTADVLGAVADSFNLTIANLRKLVEQVKVAAQQVSTGAAENETFASSLSADALRQAEELAATLNSVQVLTNSIQQVAASAREANIVARSASTTARKGGESVEHTVAGILKIRETVAESTRKVKRLAESSQEISKIVALISQIASRTNLLALNASIEAARAGEAGRGFAVVADEVRQLADRAAKASKEIEQLVLQIQGETSSVMSAMEEGTQQVIAGTRLAEEAKRSLDDIIQVSQRIDTLVGSITAATVEQTQTSQAVAQVMQAVELTAQETSQESQRVSDSLRYLVSVARGLQDSVEQFKVE